MFFKKQAFKIKDLLKEKGIEVPLVTVQEILAKSYGFNNRHVALAAVEFNNALDLAAKAKSTKPELVEKTRNNTPLSELPYEITQDNISKYTFWWDYDGELPLHYPTTSPGSPFDEDYEFNDGDEIIIYKEEEEQQIISPTYLHYVFDKKKNRFLKQNTIKTFLLRHKKKNFYKEFEAMDLRNEEILNLLGCSSNWKEEIKRVIQHKDCPIHILRNYAQDENFYVRVTAIFSQYHRDELAYLAKDDKDARVRKAYYEYLINKLPLEELRALIKKDSGVINLLKHTRVDDVPLINW